ncbi:hypothetical protein BDN70DRAFT_906836 [Pholiota conissans]|uniref:Protein Zds1 C-terminal domain-containing protein n=1 Tax=Pholiota conissans TaxID=109636 RepID=A0A9P5YYS4_9AGAR|nr:hypothetical protein BDN70DRAFT_906836 [Pholiota conissans]
MSARPLQPSESEIQREVEVLRDLRRRSTTPGALTIDPDLPNQPPPVSPTAIWPGKGSSGFPLSPVDTSSGSFAQGSSTLQRSSSSSSTSRAPADAPNNPSDDPLHLFWVPASLHPEIAPAEFRAFLKEHARSPVDLSDSSSNTASSSLLSSSPSLSRKKSMLSRQYRPKENDGIEDENIVPLKRNRSLLYPTNPGPQLTISDLQMLEELAEEASTSDDPSKLRNVLRRSLSLNLSPSAVEMMDEMPEMGDEADVPIIVPPPGQILRRAARTKIRKPSLPGDGGGHRFGASRRGGHSKPSPAATAEPRTSSDISSSEHGDSEQSIVRRLTTSDESSHRVSRPDSYSEEASIYDSYARDDDEDTTYTIPTPVTVTPALPEPLPIEEPPIPQLPPAVPPVLYQPQPQRLNVPPPQEPSTPSRTPSPVEPVVVERPPPALAQPPPPIPAPSSYIPPPPPPASAPPTSAPNRKEKEKKGLFKWGDKGSKKGSKDRESRERAEKEKEKDSGFFGSLFGGKKKQDSDYQSSMTGGTSGREAAQALLGASKSSKSYVPPTSPGLAPGIGGNPYARYPIHVERAIYRLSHIKLANPRRPLYEQVLISNLMFWYLGVINKAQNPTPANPTQTAAANGQQPNSGGPGGPDANEREQEEREQREREQREKEAREKAEKERLEREQRERELEQKKKESGRRGSLTKPAPAGGPPGGRRAAEMPIKGPQYEMQHRVMEQEYGQGGGYNGGGAPRSPTSPTTANGGPPQGYQRAPQPGPYNGPGGAPPRGPPEQQQYYYQTPVGLPPGAMPPIEPTASWSAPQQQPQQRTSSPPAQQQQQRRLSPNAGPQRRSQSPPTHHPRQSHSHHHPHAAAQKQSLQQLNKLNTSQESLTLGQDGDRRPPGRSLSATAYSTAPAGQPALNGATLRKGNSAHASAAAPYDRERERRPSITSEARSPGGEEEDVPLAVWQQQRRK